MLYVDVKNQEHLFNTLSRMNVNSNLCKVNKILILVFHVDMDPRCWHKGNLTTIPQNERKKNISGGGRQAGIMPSLSTNPKGRVPLRT
jgi:hypothetical protein